MNVMSDAELADLNTAHALTLYTERGGVALATLLLAAFKAAGDSGYSAVLNSVPNIVAERAHWGELLDANNRVVGAGPMVPQVDVLLRPFRLTATKP